VTSPPPLALVVVGASGRLGALVVTEASARPHAFAVVGLVKRADSLAHALTALPGGTAPVVIDLATAGATAAHARACAQAGAPYVVATTGMSVADTEALDLAARTVPVLAAANLSVSAHVAARVVAEVSARLSSYDVEVVEVHHNKKRDAPSGTALLLAKAAATARAHPSPIKCARDGVSPREPGEIGVSAVRGGDVVGEHTVYFYGAGERIEIAHRITDRAVFARGALDAAAFLAAQAPGRYSMSDVVA
jgi:4-hydroxy-tetrahydrodipicolinate reductase